MINNYNFFSYNYLLRLLIFIVLNNLAYQSNYISENLFKRNLLKNKSFIDIRKNKKQEKIFQNITLKENRKQNFFLRNYELKNHNFYFKFLFQKLHERFLWFESKIIFYYQFMNKKNILIIGDHQFINIFKNSIKKYKWNAYFNFSNSLDYNQQYNKYDLIIDAIYHPMYAKYIYIYNKKILLSKVSFFLEVYTEILIDESFNFFKNIGIVFYLFNFPDINFKMMDSRDLKFFSQVKHLYGLNKKKFNEVTNILFNDNQETKKYIEDIYMTKIRKRYNDKYIELTDCNYGDLLKIENGCRRTYYVPKNTSNLQKIYFLGPCITEGTYVPDRFTIPSQIQFLANKDNKACELINYGMNSIPIINDFERILDTPLKKGDIIVSIRHKSQKILRKIMKKYNNYNFYDTTSKLFKPHNYGYWILNSGTHINKNGNRAIAEFIYDKIKSYILDSKLLSNEKRYNLENEIQVKKCVEENQEFKKYLNYLNKMKNNKNITGKIGSIVMNCNPFTYGHKYLVEKSLKQVDYLYIFVVEEDKSIFPFKDRFLLVKKGVSDLGKNIEVIPSGKWIISLLTFPEYFGKETLQEEVIDPSKDLELFGKYICPSLGISVRFAGQEPFDKITKQYNEKMRKILPLFGVDFVEIPRKSFNKNEVISATLVRDIIKNNSTSNLSKLYELVPPTTLDYIKNKFFKFSIMERKKFNT